MGILFWAIISGIALKNTASDSTKTMLADFSECVSTVVKFIINFAPFGIMGLVYNAVSNGGLDIFTVYGRMILLLAGCMLFVCFVSNPLIMFIMTGKNPYPLSIRCLKESGITAFFTRSSAANIPMNMTLCEKLGLDRDLFSISIMTLAAVSTLGIQINIFSALILSILATFAACGASGVAGGSLLLIPLACSLFGIPNDIAMEVVGVGFIIGVVQDSFETALNSSSDVIFTYVADYLSRKRRVEERFNG